MKTCIIIKSTSSNSFLHFLQITLECALLLLISISNTEKIISARGLSGRDPDFSLKIGTVFRDESLLLQIKQLE